VEEKKEEATEEPAKPATDGNDYPDEK